MALWDQLKWSLRHSKRQFLESILVVLAITLGVGVIITVLAMVLSVGQQYRANEQAEHFRTLELMGKIESIRRDGAPLALLGSDSKSVDWSATLEELEEFQEHLPSTMHAYVEMHWSATTPLLPEEDSDEESTTPWYSNTNQLFIMGTTPDYFSFNGSTLQRGNFFLPDDVKKKNPVIVLPDSLATELFGDSNPLGQDIPVVLFGDGASADYTVIGVLDPPEEEEVGFRFGNMRMAYAPVTMSPYATSGEGDEMQFSNVSIGLDVGVDIAAALEIATSEARLIWGDQVALRSSLVEFRESQQQTQRYALLIGVFASVGLVIAVINILNLMLARVLKRTKSVGLSMALGSSRKMVFRQFMMEAFTLGMVGSFLGILFSFALVKILENAIGVFFATGMWGTRVLLGIAIGLVVSLFFGVYPAYLGSRTNPVDALRTD
ncbi:MAG TPA: ABC transporter permease [Limnochordia bacterium]|nr:ABC transporter permease [Limnochordia bacterium]